MSFAQPSLFLHRPSSTMVGNHQNRLQSWTTASTYFIKRFGRQKLTAQAKITKFHLGDDLTKHVDLCKKEWKCLRYHDERTWPHLFSIMLDNLSNKWYKIEEVRGDTFTQQTLRENFIKYFSLTPDDEKLKLVTKQIQQFIGAKSSNETVKSNLTKKCRYMSVNEIQHSTRQQLENDHF